MSYSYPLHTKSNDFKISVKQGCIHVNSAWVSRTEPGVVIIEVDCRAKYPQIGALSLGVVTLEKSRETLRAEAVDEPTEIKISGVPEGWTVDATVGRYSVLIFLWKPEDGGLLWSDAEDSA